MIKKLKTDIKIPEITINKNQRRSLSQNFINILSIYNDKFEFLNED